MKTPVSIVSYRNSSPYYYGLTHSPVNEKIVLSSDTPSACAEKLATAEVSIGLVPVAAIPAIPGARIIAPYCIGADGPVTSVMLYSNVPLNSIRTVLLDYQSKTSVMLCRILASNHWHITPEWKSTEEGYEKFIGDDVAGLVIGDRALGLRGNFQFAYDLSEEWKKMTGLPFVFAIWLANRKFEKVFEDEFRSALAFGVANKDKAAALGPDPDGTLAYLENHIRYEFDEGMKSSLDIFLGLMKRISL